MFSDVWCVITFNWDPICLFPERCPIQYMRKLHFYKLLWSPLITYEIVTSTMRSGTMKKKYNIGFNLCDHHSPLSWKQQRCKRKFPDNTAKLINMKCFIIVIKTIFDSNQTWMKHIIRIFKWQIYYRERLRCLQFMGCMLFKLRPFPVFNQIAQSNHTQLPPQ